MFCAEHADDRARARAPKPVYEDIATKFFEHFLYIADAMNNLGGEGISLWNERTSSSIRRAAMPDDRTACRSRCARSSG
jgi:hypothetical protein